MTRRTRGRPEGNFQDTIIELAEWNHWRLYHVARVQKQLRSHTSVGFPDLILLRAERGIAAEAKSATGRVSAAQRAWLAAFARIGFETYVWRPRDWDAVYEILTRLEIHP